MVDLWRVSPISLHFKAALDCLSNPVLPNTDTREHLPVIINGSGQRVGTCSLVLGSAQTQQFEQGVKQVNESDKADV